MVSPELGDLYGVQGRALGAGWSPQRIATEGSVAVGIGRIRPTSDGSVPAAVEGRGMSARATPWHHPGSRRPALERETFELEVHRQRMAPNTGTRTQCQETAMSECRGLAALVAELVPSSVSESTIIDQQRDDVERDWGSKGLGRGKLDSSNRTSQLGSPARHLGHLLLEFGDAPDTGSCTDWWCHDDPAEAASVQGSARACRPWWCSGGWPRCLGMDVNASGLTSDTTKGTSGPGATPTSLSPPRLPTRPPAAPAPGRRGNRREQNEVEAV